ncbi:MAG: hypothetical protein B6D41_05770 [Chloroflexi bacterium UTCFX4]|jgi:excisionase family DNA binding protein|nr:MAG: hypothetical protein B6D41_05770 [Chloroflexi bacterium UTCFX4]
MEKSVDSHKAVVDVLEAEWLPLRKASRKLGVTAATLRGWADEGRVPSYRTPGGHRRFRVDAATPLTAQTFSEGPRRWQLLEYSALGRARVALEERMRTRGVLIDASPRAQIEYRALGRQVTQQLAQALQSDPLTEKRVIELGKRYARLQRRYHVELGVALQALGFFRSAFIASVVEFNFGIGQPEPEQLIVWLERANAAIDAMGAAMVESMLKEPQQDA